MLAIAVNVSHHGKIAYFLLFRVVSPKTPEQKLTTKPLLYKKSLPYCAVCYSGAVFPHHFQARWLWRGLTPSNGAGWQGWMSGCRRPCPQSAAGKAGAGRGGGHEGGRSLLRSPHSCKASVRRSKSRRLEATCRRDEQERI